MRASIDYLPTGLLSRILLSCSRFRQLGSSMALWHTEASCITNHNMRWGHSNCHKTSGREDQWWICHASGPAHADHLPDGSDLQFYRMADHPFPVRAVKRCPSPQCTSTEASVQLRRAIQNQEPYWQGSS